MSRSGDAYDRAANRARKLEAETGFDVEVYEAEEEMRPADYQYTITIKGVSYEEVMAFSKLYHPE